MMNAANKRPLLLVLTLAILLCGAMALGGTWATNFTAEGTQDTTTYGSDNTLNYNVAVKYGTSATNAYILDFSANSKPFTNNTLWCPGKTEIVYFQVTNNENFVVQCVMDLFVTENGFDNMIKYAVISNDIKTLGNPPASWTEFVEQAVNSQSSVLQVCSTTDTDIKNPVFTVDLAPNASQCYALAIHMEELTPNKYQNEALNMNIRFRVNANYIPNETPTLQ